MELQAHSTQRSPNVQRVRVHGSTLEGQRVTIDVAATSHADAVRQMRRCNIRVERIDESGPSQNALRLRKSFPLLLFSQELLALLDAGLTVTEALQVLHSKERNAPVRAVLQRITASLHEGHSFSATLEVAPEAFPPIFVASVRAAERTGDLPRALTRYIAYQTQFNEIQKKVVAASIYPAALLVVGLLVCLFLVGYVLPRFSAVYDGTGRDIPWASLMLLSAGRLMAQHWILMGLLCALAVIAVAVAIRQAPVRQKLLGVVLSLPWLGARAAEFRLIRFYRATSLLAASGVPLPRALGMAEGLLDGVQRSRLKAVRAGVNEGRPLSVAMVDAGLATVVAESLLKVGERSGQMSEMLERIAKFQEDELSRVIDWASRLLEPVLMAFIGIIVGGVVLLMYMPIFELAGSIQ